MKKNELLNAELSGLIARLGHTDTIVIGDAGLPVPNGVPCIDLALMRGIPSFEQTLKAILSEMAVESYTIASESGDDFLKLCSQKLPQVAKKSIPHEQLKQLSSQAKAVIRTGECSPYFNIILHANVAF
ncbi:MAG: D-ribose pyranase [Brevinema sp.]